jgi:predicted transcriptional regulator of viral defense system
MKKIDLIHGLAGLDRRGVFVFAKRDLEKMFPEEGEKAMEKSLARMVSDGLLVRAAKGVYVNPAAASKHGRIIEDVAKALRPGCFSYVSLESMLSEYGVISQIPIDRITVMTTGRNGVYRTPYGTVEFTHTKRGPADIIERTEAVEGRPLRIAKKDAALRDLRRVGRNVGMLDDSELVSE